MKHSAMETCLCGSRDPFLFIRIHIKIPLAASRLSINSSEMIGIKGSKHSLLTKVLPPTPRRLPPAAPRPPPSRSPPLTGPFVPPSQKQLRSEQRHRGAGAGACGSGGRKHEQRRRVELKGREQQPLVDERAREHAKSS